MSQVNCRVSENLSLITDCRQFEINTMYPQSNLVIQKKMLSGAKKHDFHEKKVFLHEKG